MKQVTLLLLFVLASTFVMAQQKYPLEILPNKTVKVESKNDTLWVINNDQIQKYITDQMTLEEATKTFHALRRELESLEGVVSGKNDIIKRFSAENTKMVTQNKEVTEELERTKDDLKKAKSKNKLWTGVGVLVGGVLSGIAFMLL